MTTTHGPDTHGPDTAGTDTAGPDTAGPDTRRSPRGPGSQRDRRAGAAPAAGGTFRPDIEGLRAVAVLLVVLAHSGVVGLSGGFVGVDVFFVISGFLITSLLLRELGRTDRIAIGRFYARRAMRLLPASTVVGLTTLLASWFWLSPLRIGDLAHDAIASAFSFVNIRLARTGTDYFAADAAPSPFQHFWSLAVEEQFYLVWPLLMVVTCVWWRARSHRGGRVRLAATLVALSAASFALSWWLTGVSAPWAYFGAHTRAWELGVGALLAVGANRIHRLPPVVAAVLGWAGLTAVVTAAVTFDDGTPFPGTAAALPVLGAAAVIAAGAGASRRGVPALLSTSPMQIVGRLSYGWYLWHWPVLMIAPTALGLTPGVPLNLALCAAALALAWVTFHLVENPMRHRRGLTARPVLGLGLGLALSATVAAVALTAAAVPHTVPVGNRATDVPAALDAATDPAATLTRLVARARRTTDLPANLKPALNRAPYDVAGVTADGCHVPWEVVKTPGACVYGDPASTTTVVLYGDSHAAQWFPAMQRLAEERHWKLVSLTKSACTATDVPIMHETLKRPFTECVTWHRNTVARITALKPALIVVATSFAFRLVDAKTDLTTQWRAGWDRTLTALRRSGAPVTVIADTPYMVGQVPACVSEAPHDVVSCGRPRRTALYGPEQRAVVFGHSRDKGVTIVDATPWLCSDFCPAVIGNVLVYRDSNHLTAVYSRALAPLLGKHLDPRPAT